MDTHHKEAIGFLARWLLLAFGGVCFAVFAWTAKHALASAVVGNEADVVLSDAVWRPWRRMHATGYLFPPGWAAAHTQFMAVAPGDHSWIAYVNRDRVYATVQDTSDPSVFPVGKLAPSGRMLDVAIKGIPYSGYAFRAAEAKLLILPRGRRLYAVDVRLALGDQQAARSVVGKLRRTGNIAMFYPGQDDLDPRQIADEYIRLREQVRLRFPDCPLVFTITRKQGKMDCLRQIRMTVRGTGSALPVVITGDASLAEMASRERFPVHLVGRPELIDPSGGPTCHRTMEDFGIYLDVHGGGSG